MKLFFILLTLLLVVSGCSTKVSYKKPAKNETPPYSLKNKTSISVALYEEYAKWHKTPYRLGGNSFRGVDCSSLVQSIYRDAFKISVPRTTKEQAKIGYKVSKVSLKEGDLVLFKTGYNVRHSGVYLERGNFINASTSYGVTISNLNNPYWKSKYWQSRRVLP